MSQNFAAGTTGAVAGVGSLSSEAPVRGNGAVNTTTTTTTTTAAATTTTTTTMADFGEGDSDYYPNPYTQPEQPPHDTALAPPTMSRFRREEQWEVNDARPMLPMAAFFMGDLRDGIAMINMQSTFLMSAKGFTEKQVGILFFVFGVFQTICMAPVGYWFDYIENKIRTIMGACVAISTLTVLTAILAQPDGSNMKLLIVLKALQGTCTAFLPPGLNGITLGIVGSSGFTQQVARNKMYSHIGTALTVAIATLIAYGLFPQMGPLFFVSPLATYGCCYYFARIKPEHIDSDAARGLIINSPTMTEYQQMDEENEAMQAAAAADGGASTSYCGTTAGGGGSSGSVPPDCWGSSSSGGGGGQEAYVPPQVEVAASERPPDAAAAAGHDGIGTSFLAALANNDKPTVPLKPKGSDASGPHVPSFRFGWWGGDDNRDHDAHATPVGSRRAQTPLAVLLDPTLLTFTAVIFFFHLANSSVLPLVMQSLSHGAVTRSGILYSSLCIIVAQATMTIFSGICGVYSPIWGRKRLFLAGFFSLPLRCFLLSVLVSPQTGLYDALGEQAMDVLVMATQFLDAVGAGIFGTLYVLVTSDIAGGSGRFSLLLGITTGAMCIGGMLSGYIGQALAQDYGYDVAFYALGLLSLIPAFLYLFFMPETLPDHAKPKPKKRKQWGHHILTSIHRETGNALAASWSPNEAAAGGGGGGGAGSTSSKRVPIVPQPTINGRAPMELV